MKKEKKKKMLGIGVLVILVTLGGLAVIQRIQFYRTIKVLNSMDPKTVTLFKIYPRAGRPVETPVEFHPPDPIIGGFLQAVTDFRTYRSSPGSVASFDHVWFLEIATGKGMIQMSCSIPHEKGDIVTGWFGKFNKTRTIYYDSFQSQLLYQWYQKYSHRWLNPASQQDTGG